MVPQLVLATDALTVLSGSMEPAISIGSVVFVYDVEPSGLQVDDVITFSRNGGPVTTHRITEVQGTGENLRFEVKGDANDGPDAQLVEAGDIIGEVKFSIPYLGYALNYASGVSGYLYLVIVPALLIIVDEFVKIGKELRSMKSSGDEQKAMYSFMIVISFFILLLTAAMYTDVLPQLSELAADTGTDPTTFGIVLVSLVAVAAMFLWLI